MLKSHIQRRESKETNSTIRILYSTEQIIVSIELQLMKFTYLLNRAFQFTNVIADKFFFVEDAIRLLEHWCFLRNKLLSKDFVLVFSLRYFKPLKNKTWEGVEVRKYKEKLWRKKNERDSMEILDEIINS